MMKVSRWIDAQEETSCWFRVFLGSNELRLSFSFSNSLLFEENAHWRGEDPESNRGSGNRKLFPGYRKLLELSRQVREGMRSTNSFIFEKSTSNYYLSNPIRVVLTKPFYHCHSTGVVGNKRRSQAWQTADSFKKKKKKIIFHPSRILPSKCICEYARDYAL